MKACDSLFTNAGAPFQSGGASSWKSSNGETAISADVDVCEAFVAKWNADPTLGSVVPGGLRSDQLVPLEKQTSPVVQPYARLTVGPSAARQNLPSTIRPGGQRNYIDFRDAKVEIFGIGKAAVGGVVSAVKAVFDETPLVVPNAAWMRTEDLGKDKVEDDPERKRGDEVRKATIIWMVWTHRQAG